MDDEKKYENEVPDRVCTVVRGERISRPSSDLSCSFQASTTFPHSSPWLSQWLVLRSDPSPVIPAPPRPAPPCLAQPTSTSGSSCVWRDNVCSQASRPR
ncbi:hypothetical protein E2C01_078719 [Portunus trituberculatus]|uniref:Uncharacterized protein n=1 Tax=Portunus trituberculatus TaxID=210409 RepID=A0A5B7INI0_PORTR|nr:hypothetical protein [Portunus trituberculatus]